VIVLCSFVDVQGKQFEASLYEKLHGTDVIVGSPPHGLPTNIVLQGLFITVCSAYTFHNYIRSLLFCLKFSQICRIWDPTF